MANTPRSSDPDVRGPISDKINPVVFCFTPIFLGLVQLKYGNRGASPYTTHPVAMAFGIACLLGSCLACLLKNVYLPDSYLHGAYGHALELAEVLLGSLWLISLVTMLLPSSWSWTTFSIVVYIFLSVGFGALIGSMLVKCKRCTSSETGTADGNLPTSGVSAVHQESELPV